MAVVKDDKLAKMIRAGELAPIYFFYGSEIHLMKEMVSLIIKKAVPPAFESFNLHLFQDDNTTVNGIQTVYDALPMMSEYKCVAVKNWNIDKLGKQDFDQLMNMLGRVNPSTVLVLYDTRQTVDPKKNAKYKKLSEAAAKVGIVTEFALKDKGSLKKAITARCQKAGVSISPELCERLIDQSGSQYAVILNEADKLIAYAGEGGIVTEESVELLGISSVQNTAFDLSNAILKNQYGRAFTILDRLFYLRVEPVMILGALAGSFVSLYRVKAAQMSGLGNDQVISDFHYRSKYQVQKLSQDVSRFSISQIRSCIASLEKADRLLKSSRLDNRIILEQMLGEMISASAI
ncbi:MAG: DNA polymerase III subunit delta [Massilimaliae sp.]|nr:DNA polymerase III subunit delta [Massiliimalia sp.]